MNEKRPIPFNSASRDEEPVPEEYGEGPLESLFKPGGDMPAHGTKAKPHGNLPAPKKRRKKKKTGQVLRSTGSANG